jgi:hypothetical protein
MHRDNASRNLPFEQSGFSTREFLCLEFLQLNFRSPHIVGALICNALPLAWKIAASKSAARNAMMAARLFARLRRSLSDGRRTAVL